MAAVQGFPEGRSATGCLLDSPIADKRILTGAELLIAIGTKSGFCGTRATPGARPLPRPAVPTGPDIVILIVTQHQEAGSAEMREARVFEPMKLNHHVSCASMIRHAPSLIQRVKQGPLASGRLRVMKQTGDGVLRSTFQHFGFNKVRCRKRFVEFVA